MELLIGCGSNKKRCFSRDGKKEWDNLITLDINADHRPDVVWDLNNRPLPFDDNTFDEIQAVEVLEHLGSQGNFKGFFEEFSEYWRILKPDGILFGTSPHYTSQWAWGDPSHTRIISQECLSYLVQPEYEKQVGKTAFSDFRFCYKADFDLVLSQVSEDRQYVYALKAVKPSRIKL